MEMVFPSVILAVTPVSSRTSRKAAVALSSPASTFPFGKSHLPLLKIIRISSFSFLTIPPAARINSNSSNNSSKDC